MHGTCLNVQKSNFSLVLLNEKKAKKKEKTNMKANLCLKSY